jgi:hypothetical protein
MLLHKIVKKVESLIDLYEEKYVGDTDLQLLKLQFYSVHLPNKLKIKHLISSIEYRKLSLKNKVLVFEINERSNEMKSAELIDASKAEDEYELFSTCATTQRGR